MKHFARVKHVALNSIFAASFAFMIQGCDRKPISSERRQDSTVSQTQGSQTDGAPKVSRPGDIDTGNSTVQTSGPAINPANLCRGKPNFECRFDEDVDQGTVTWKLYDNCRQVSVHFDKDVAVKSAADCDMQLNRMYEDDGLYCVSALQGGKPYFGNRLMIAYVDPSTSTFFNKFLRTIYSRDTRDTTKCDREIAERSNFGGFMCTEDWGNAESRAAQLFRIENFKVVDSYALPVDRPFDMSLEQCANAKRTGVQHNGYYCDNSILWSLEKADYGINGNRGGGTGIDEDVSCDEVIATLEKHSGRYCHQQSGYAEMYDTSLPSWHSFGGWGRQGGWTFATSYKTLAECVKALN